MTWARSRNQDEQIWFGQSKQTPSFLCNVLSYSKINGVLIHSLWQAETLLEQEWKFQQFEVKASYRCCDVWVIICPAFDVMIQSPSLWSLLVFGSLRLVVFTASLWFCGWWLMLMSFFFLQRFYTWWYVTFTIKNRKLLLDHMGTWGRRWQGRLCPQWRKYQNRRHIQGSPQEQTWLPTSMQAAFIRNVWKSLSSLTFRFFLKVSI